MKWTDTLTVKEHLSFIEKLNRVSTEIGDVLTAYEATQIFERIRLLANAELFEVGKGDDSFEALAKVIALRTQRLHQMIDVTEGKKVPFDKNILRSGFNSIIESMVNIAGDYVSFMAYCEYLALKKEGQSDALNATWEEWQENVEVKPVLEAFYNRVAEERRVYWTESAVVEERELDIPVEPKKERNTEEVPLEKKSDASR